MAARYDTTLSILVYMSACRCGWMYRALGWVEYVCARVDFIVAMAGLEVIFQRTEGIWVDRKG